MSRRIRVALLVAVLALLAVFVINTAGALRLFYPRAVATVAGLPPAAPYRAGQRVLLISPHPDDESLCCAGSIQHALKAGAQVWIAWVTNGDGFEFDAIYLDRRPRPRPREMLALGERRMREAGAAARALGVPNDHLSFLGYPDGGTLHLFLENYAAPYTSRYTGARAVPYAGALSPGAPYTGEALERDLARVLDEVRPDVVLVPSPLDQHPDHRAASYFVTRLLAQRGETGKLRFWIVHGGLEWPLPKGLHENFPLILPPRGRGLAWERLDLSDAERAKKLAALRAHKSQIAVLDRFMLAFVRENELLTRQVTPFASGRSEVGVPLRHANERSSEQPNASP